MGGRGTWEVVVYGRLWCMGGHRSWCMGGRGVWEVVVYGRLWYIGGVVSSF